MSLFAIVRVHPMPVILIPVLVALAVVIPPLAITWRSGLWSATRRRTITCIASIVACLALCSFDLYSGWRWRQAVPGLDVDARAMPWWWTPYWPMVVDCVLVVFSTSLLVSGLLWIVT